MTKKDDLIAEANELGIELDSRETIADLEAKIDAFKTASPVSEGSVKRARLNRGSRRRIERAAKRLDDEMKAAIQELDVLAFLADDDGNRLGEWPAVSLLREARREINNHVNQLLAG